MNHFFFKSLFLAAWMPFSFGASHAQEWSFGVHLNPTATIVHPVGTSVGNPDLQMDGRVHAGYNAGLNVKYRWQRWGIETALNGIQKSVRFQQSTFDGLALGNTQYYSGVNSISLETPLLLSYTFLQHHKKRWYDVEFVVGGSHEWYFTNSFFVGSQGNDYASSVVTASDVDAQLATKGQWFNGVVGIQLRTFIRKLGLFEYGVVYHHPFGTVDYKERFSMADDKGNTATYTSQTAFRTGYLDFKIAYYFLHFQQGKGRIRYR